MPILLPLLLGCAAGATPPADAPDAPAGPKGVDAADVPNGACAWPLPFDPTSPSFTTSIADLDGDGAVDTVVEQSAGGSGGGVRWLCVRDGATGTAACDEAEWWVYSPFSAGRRLANPGRDGQALRLLDAIEARRALLEPRKPPSDGSPGLAVEPSRRLRLDAADPALAGLFALASPPPTQGTWSPPLRWYRGPAPAQAGVEFSARELPRFSAAPAWSDEPGAPWTASYTASPSGRGMAAFFSASAPPPPPSAVTIGPMTVRVLGDAVVAEVGAERHAWLASWAEGSGEGFKVDRWPRDLRLRAHGETTVAVDVATIDGTATVTLALGGALADLRAARCEAGMASAPADKFSTIEAGDAYRACWRAAWAATARSAARSFLGAGSAALEPTRLSAGLLSPGDSGPPGAARPGWAEAFPDWAPARDAHVMVPVAAARDGGWLATGGGAGHVERCTPWTADDFPQVGPDGGCGPGDVSELTELARADFDGDGVEDVLLEIEAAQRGACWAMAWVVVATRRAPDGLLVPVAASWAVRSG